MRDGLTLPPGVRRLRFLWWNLHNFSHYLPTRAGLERWPSTEEQYQAKLGAVVTAMRHCVATYGPFDLVGLSESTYAAAEELRDRAFEGYHVYSPDDKNDPNFHVAVIYADGPSFRLAIPLAGYRLSRSTRPTIVLDYHGYDYVVRFLLAHWTAPFDENGLRNLEGLAVQTRQHIYDFLEQSATNYVVLVGDLNTEPFEITRTHLYAGRSHRRATSKAHYSDDDIGRPRLYNCGWRLLGEKTPHSHSSTGSSASGTYYGRYDWHTFDQIIVSGNLLHETPPLIEEREVMVLSDDLLLHNGLPEKFAYSAKESRGISDHLPLVGSLLIPEL